MAFYDRWLDSTMQRLGYTKAGAASVPITAAFAGEAPLAPELNFGEYSDEQRERLALCTPWVFSNIREVANLAGNAPLGVYRRQGEELEAEVDHELERIMRRPNPHMSGTWMKQYTLWWWMLRGEAYWWKIPDRTGQLTELYPIPSSRMAPIPHPVKYISGFRYHPGGGQQDVILPAEQIVFFRTPNPFDYHRGLSPLSAARLAMETDRASTVWNRETFTNEVTLRMLLSLPAEMPAPLFAQAKAELIAELVENRKRFLIARAGGLKAEPLSMAPKDMEFLAGRDFTRRELDRIYGFPEGYWSEKANRANAEAARASLIEGVIWPLLVLMHDTITSSIVVPEYGEDYVAAFDDLRPRDRGMLVAERRQYWLVTSLNEARGDLKMAGYEGPLAEVIADLPVPLATNPQFVLTLAGFAPMAGGMPGAARSEPGGNALPAGSEEKALRDDLKRWEGISCRRVRNGNMPDYLFESEHIPAGLRGVLLPGLKRAHSENAVKALFASPFYTLATGDEGAAILATAAALCPGSVDFVLDHPAEFSAKAILGRTDEIPQWRLDLEDSFGAPAQAYFEGQVSRLTGALPRADYGLPGPEFWSGEDALLAAFLTAYLEQWAEKGIGANVDFLAQVGLGIDANVNARAAAWAGRHALELARNLNATTKELARAKVANWLRQPSRLAEDLEKDLRRMIAPRWRAELIAQSEITLALSAAHEEVGVELGPIRKGDIWSTAHDERVCPVCAPLNGARRDPGGLYPGGYGPPPAHPRCRCGESFEV
jgi:HK97 family phage portal protein